MKGPVKAILLVLAVVVITGGAFWGGSAYQKAQGGTGLPASGDGQGLRGGPMANLTEEQQAEIENMTAEERQQWFQENMPAGGPQGSGQAGPMRGGTLEGEVLEIADDTLTVRLDSGSQTFYTDADTVIAYVKGAGDLTTGSTVMIMATPSGADGVTTASLVVVK
jgi:hypothetical protein